MSGFQQPGVHWSNSIVVFTACVFSVGGFVNLLRGEVVIGPAFTAIGFLALVMGVRSRWPDSWVLMGDRIRQRKRCYLKGTLVFMNDVDMDLALTSLEKSMDELRPYIMHGRKRLEFTIPHRVARRIGKKQFRQMRKILGEAVDGELQLRSRSFQETFIPKKKRREDEYSDSSYEANGESPVTSLLCLTF